MGKHIFKQFLTNFLKFLFEMALSVAEIELIESSAKIIIFHRYVQSYSPRSASNQKLYIMINFVSQVRKL